MKLLKTEDLAVLFGLSTVHVRDRTVHLPDFPRARRIGAARRWVEDEVMEWLDRAPKRHRSQSKSLASSAASA
jgi:predicted DNA-binding transcriptional regulator AlpA